MTVCPLCQQYISSRSCESLRRYVDDPKTQVLSDDVNVGIEEIDAGASVCRGCMYHTFVFDVAVEAAGL
jgi:hypothetical protein